MQYTAAARLKQESLSEAVAAGMEQVKRSCLNPATFTRVDPLARSLVQRTFRLFFLLFVCRAVRSTRCTSEAQQSVRAVECIVRLCGVLLGCWHDIVRRTTVAAGPLISPHRRGCSARVGSNRCASQIDSP